MDLIDTSPKIEVLVSIAGFVIGAAKAGMPAGGALGIPIIFLCFPIQQATAIVAIMLCVADVGATAIHHFQSSIDWAAFRTIAKAALLGIIIGSGIWWVLINLQIDERSVSTSLKRLIGLVAILFSGYIVGGERYRNFIQQHGLRRLSPWTWGIIIGAWTTLANVAGPLLGLYYWTRGLDQDRHRFTGTVAITFLMINWAKLPFYWSLGLLSGPSLRYSLSFLPAIILGLLAGYCILHNLSQRVFKIVLAMLSSFMGVLMLLGIDLSAMLKGTP